MLNVVCPGCSETFAVPEDLAQGHCVHCGQVFALIQAQPAAASVNELAQSIRLDGPLQPAFPGGQTALAGPPERYESWDEFRSASPAVQRELLQLATKALPDLRRVHVEPIPEDAPAELDGWGRPVGTIHVAGENRPVHLGASLALLGVGLLLIAGAALTILHAGDGGDTPTIAAIVIPLLAGIGFVAAAAWVTFVRRSHLATTMWIFEEGIYLSRFGKTCVAPWEMVRDYEASTESGKPRYRLTVNPEWQLIIHVGHAPQSMPLMEYIETRLASVHFLRRLEAIWLGQRLQFGIVALSRAGFEHRWILAPWSEVRRVVPDGKSLFLDWTQHSEWVPIRYQEVSFPHVVMAISHVLIDEHSRLGPASA